MSAGQMLKRGFDQLLGRFGEVVLIHKQWGTPAQTTHEQRGMKNNEKGRPDEVMFQFPNVVDINEGDVLQQKAARDLWRVVETEDNVVEGVLVSFEAKVEKVSGQAARRLPSGSHVTINAPVYGGVQVGNSGASQNVSVQVLSVDANLEELRKLLQKASLSELEKEEAHQTLDRIAALARKDRSAEVIHKVKEKLELVKATFGVANDLANLASPYIAAIAQTLCL